MKIPRRQFLHLAAGAAALPAVSRIARAQAYPSRPITIIAPFAAGGTTDLIGRIMAERLRASFGQPVLVENVTGANGSIGVGRVARARAERGKVVEGPEGAFGVAGCRNESECGDRGSERAEVASRHVSLFPCKLCVHAF